RSPVHAAGMQPSSRCRPTPASFSGTALGAARGSSRRREIAACSAATAASSARPGRRIPAAADLDTIQQRMTDSVQFFDAQFRRQDAAREFALNPFELRALPYVEGSVLELGCGLGNLSMAAAKKGARVLALDASPAAIESLAARVKEHRLQIEARRADLTSYDPPGEFDSVVAIG